jgi:hypothetical protein
MSVPPAWGRTQACMRVSVCYTAHTRMRVCARCVRGAIEAKTMNEQTLANALAQALMPLLATLAQPAETVTQAVVSVAKTGQRRISADVRAKVKALRAHNGGPLHSHDPAWKLIDAEIVDAQGNLIADAMAPTATKVTATKDAPTDKQLMRMKKSELIDMLQGRV